MSQITWVMGKVGPCRLCGGENTAEDKRQGLVEKAVNLESLALTSLKLFNDVIDRMLQ